MSVRLPPTFRELTPAGRPHYGIWVSSGSTTAAEICAGAGLDAVFIDMEHSANTLESVYRQLQATAAYPVATVVRVPVLDAVIIKQVLDLGAESILVPMIASAAETEEAVRAVHYPPRGVRGVGAGLARSSRWGRVDDYLRAAAQRTSLVVQIESAAGVQAASAIAAVPGVDGVLIGPADLAVSMGYGADQTHPDVQDAVRSVLTAVRAAGQRAGVNAFDPAMADAYAADGADFLTVGADVVTLARGTEALAQRFIG